MKKYDCKDTDYLGQSTILPCLFEIIFVSLPCRWVIDHRLITQSKNMILTKKALAILFWYKRHLPREDVKIQTLGLKVNKKIYYITRDYKRLEEPHSAYTLQKHLLRINLLSKKHPNSGSLRKAMDKFFKSTGLTSVTIGEGVTSIGYYAFSKSEPCKIYVNRGTKTLLSLWDDGYTNVYYIGTDVNAIKPVLSLVSATQTTLKVKIDNYAEEFKYEYDDGIVGKEPFMITGLCPDVEEKVTVSISSDDKKIDINSTFMPQSLSLQIEASDITATSFSVSGSYSKGDALVTTESLKVYNDEVEGSAREGCRCGQGTPCPYLRGDINADERLLYSLCSVE